MSAPRLRDEHLRVPLALFYLEDLSDPGLPCRVLQ
jgi:hypothetical protein